QGVALRRASGANPSLTSGHRPSLNAGRLPGAVDHRLPTIALGGAARHPACLAALGAARAGVRQALPDAAVFIRRAILLSDALDAVARRSVTKQAEGGAVVV